MSPHLGCATAQVKRQHIPDMTEVPSVSPQVHAPPRENRHPEFCTRCSLALLDHFATYNCP